MNLSFGNPSTMHLSTRLSLSGALFLGLAIAAAPSKPSPDAKADLICHSDNPAECYPRVFVPTPEFQTIRDDQDIPPGLHVRLDIYTGKKEARLNIPVEGEEEQVDVPTQQALVIVDEPEEPEQATEEEQPVDDLPKALRDQISKKPPTYEAAGKILPPREPDGSVTDSENFKRAVDILISDPMADHSSALVALLELSHDIYYGVELMKKGAVVQRLMQIMFEDAPRGASTATYHRQAAGIIANSIQNNPTALKEAQVSWRSFLPHPHSPSSSSDLQAHAADQEFVSRMLTALNTETDRSAMKAMIYALSGLVKNNDFRDIFLEMRGLGHLLTIFRHEGSEWDAVRIKLAQFVADNFLDEDMGAELGKWPTEASDSRSVCTQELEASSGTNDACWPFFVTEFIQNSKDRSVHDEWLTPFVKLLNKAYEPFREDRAEEIKTGRVDTKSQVEPDLKKEL